MSSRADGHQTVRANDAHVDPVTGERRDYRLVLHKIDDETIRRAQLRVCHHATDPDDARDLLEYIGLVPGQRTPIVR